MALEGLFRNAPADAFTQPNLYELLEPLVREHGKGSVFWPLRVALSGLTASPDPVSIMEILGAAETARRLALAREKLGA